MVCELGLGLTTRLTASIVVFGRTRDFSRRVRPDTNWIGGTDLLSQQA